MEIVILQDPDKVCRYSARLIADIIRKKPNAVLGLATGSSQLGLYRELIRMHQEEGLDFSGVRTFCLDEYVGLPLEHPCSYHSIMRKNFFDHVNIRPENTCIPNGNSSDIAKECRLYEARIQEVGGIDFQMLGLGADGHIGFNEPTSSFASRTRLKALTEKTRYDRTPFFRSLEHVPRHVITMGLGTIMDSERVLLLAFGEKKRDVIAKVVEGPLTAMVPASVMQFHAKAKIVIDEAASGSLKMKSYYKWAFENKPRWQGL